MSETPRPKVPYAADETTMLRAFLDSYRATLLRQVDGLDRAQLAQTLPGGHPTSLSLGGLVKHLALVEDWWFGENLIGTPPQPEFAGIDWDADPDYEFRTAADDEPAHLVGLLTAAIERSNAALDSIDSLDTIAVRRHPRTDEGISARWIVVHMIEEYARHCGHADLLREGVDGATDL
ncbi:MAG TPA: DinB family protein [Nocardioides sp.]|nr:DinB family protein [Nocardioides sp.]